MCNALSHPELEQGAELGCVSLATAGEQDLLCVPRPDTSKENAVVNYLY